MTAPLILALAMLVPGQAPDRPDGPPADKFTPDPSWKPLDKTGTRSSSTPSRSA